MVEDIAPACAGGSCQLFGLFGIFVQGLIGAWCVFTLVLLWQCETPRRPFLTWLGDMSKQLVGACWGHFMNIFIAILFGAALETKSADNQCVWYLVGFMSDIIFVTFLCWWVTAFMRPRIKWCCGIDIGDYEASSACEGDEPEDRPLLAGMPPWLMWCCQTGIWLFIMTTVKLVVSAGVFLAQGFLYAWVTFAFRSAGLCGRPNAQLVASVIIVPVIGDAFQFAVQDGFLKKTDPKQRPLNSVSAEDEETTTNESCEGEPEREQLA